MPLRFLTQKLEIKLLALMTLTACGTVKIRSTPPEAEVFVILPGVASPKQVGKTPFESSVSRLSDEAKNGSVVLMVTKSGFFPSYFIVPNLTGGDLEIETSLRPNLSADYQQVNRIVTLLFKAERMIKEKRFDEAIKTADEIRALNENMAAAYHIKGTVYLLQNDLTRSRFEWKRAVELEPNNNEAQQMLKVVEDKLGTKDPQNP